MELPGRCGDWLDTATVTAQGLTLPTTRRTRDADFHLAKNADLHMATTADFLMATDRGRTRVLDVPHTVWTPHPSSNSCAASTRRVPTTASVCRRQEPCARYSAREQHEPASPRTDPLHTTHTSPPAHTDSGPHTQVLTRVPAPHVVRQLHTSCASSTRRAPATYGVRSAGGGAQFGDPGGGGGQYGGGLLPARPRGARAG